MQYIKTFEEFTRKNNAFVVRVERDFSIKPKKFEGGNLLNFYIRIFLDIDSGKLSSNSVERNAPFYTLNDVKLVKYELHPSYHERVRVSDARNNNFEIKIWTYGFYEFDVTVLLNLGQVIQLKGRMEFPVIGDEKASNKGEVY